MANIFTETHNISLVRGDDWRYEIPVIDSNNALFDWTGYANAASELRRNIDDPNPIATFTVTLSTGSIKLALAKASTVNIEPSVYLYDIQLDFPDGSLQTIIRGTLTVVADVTLL